MRQELKQCVLMFLSIILCFLGGGLFFLAIGSTRGCGSSIGPFPCVLLSIGLFIAAIIICILFCVAASNLDNHSVELLTVGHVNLNVNCKFIRFCVE